MKTFFGLVGLVAMLFLLSGGSPIIREYYVEVPASGPEELRRLVELGFDIGGVNFDKKTATLVIPEPLLSRLDVKVLSKRLIPAPDPQYKNHSEVEQFLKDTERAFPDLARVESIGRSVEGREIWAVQLTNRQSPVVTKPAVLFDAMHHAREVITPEVALDIVDYLTKNYATDAKVKRWMDHYSIWVVPMVNPDGNNRVWTQQAMWRKNTRGGYGVDNNRNYPYAWNTCNGSSGNKSSDTYRGPEPGSEPETQALISLVRRIRPIFDISYHSFSEIVIYPFGCSPHHIPEPDRAIYEGIGRELASKLVRDSGTGSYRAGTSYELLYNVDGGSIDWMYATEKVMAFVIEINGDSLGFQPSFSQWRDITVKRQRAGWQYILDKMSKPLS